MLYGLIIFFFQAEILWRGKPFLDLITNQTMAGLYNKNAKTVGIDFDAHGVKGTSGMPAGSTDMGNVSYVVPSIHPMFYIGTNAVNHTRGFTDAAGKYALSCFNIISIFTKTSLFKYTENFTTKNENFQIKF